MVAEIPDRPDDGVPPVFRVLLLHGPRGEGWKRAPGARDDRAVGPSEHRPHALCADVDAEVQRAGLTPGPPGAPMGSRPARRLAP